MYKVPKDLAFQSIIIGRHFCNDVKGRFPDKCGFISIIDTGYRHRTR